MRVPHSWLEEFLEVKAPPQQVAKMLTQAGLEVDAVEEVSPGFQNIVVARILHVEQHPNADKLRLAKVTDGTQEYSLVCGAPNCAEGMKTALAPIGAELPEEEGKVFKIRKAKLRGVVSEGMLCTERELGISDAHAGIMEFAEHIKEGTDVASLYADTIYEISLTPNLNHCASVFGVARELAALTGASLKLPQISVQEEGEGEISSKASVSILDFQQCPRYACRLITDVNVGPSPDWLVKRIEACGLRPVNNIVDATNYVLMELGHPLHAFDFDTLEGGKIVVRSPKESEELTTLDEKKRELVSSDLLICDQNRPVAIAGVMGGKDSEVGNTTRRVLLESAYFLPASIRKTSKRLGLQTDASKRFERGSDPNQVILSLDRCAQLIAEVSGGKVVSGTIDVKEQLFSEREVSCRISRIDALLGRAFSVSEVEEVFQSLQFPYVWDGQDIFTVTIPTYRVDISEEVDLIEEVARLFGFDHFTMKPARSVSSPQPHAPIYLFETKVRDRLLLEGLQELMTCDLIGPSILESVGGAIMPDEALIKVLNPTSVEQSILRTSLMPGLLQVVKYNSDHQVHDLRGFEVGRIHFREGDKFKEQTVAGVILTGKNRPHHLSPKPLEVDFYDLKGIAESLLVGLGIERFSFKPSSNSKFHLGRQAAIYVDSLEVGSIGEVHPTILRRLDLPYPVLFGEIDLHDLFQLQKTEELMDEIPKFPGSERDWTITLPSEQPVGEVLEALNRVPSRLLQGVSLLDLYFSDKIGKDKKNATFHFVYRDTKKTVAQDVVDAEHARITKEAESSIRR